MIPHEVDYDVSTCKRCGRKITDELSLERGFGPTCYKKYQAEKEAIGLIENQTTIDHFLKGDEIAN